jgi:hypothetical protein
VRSTSSAEAVATFPEIAPAARVSASFYEQRVATKGWRERWPKLRYVPSG